MDKFSLYVPNFLPQEEYFDLKKNHTCTGCGVSLAVRIIGKAVEKLLANSVCERSDKGELFGIKTEAAFLKIKNGKNEIITCLDDEPNGGLDDAIKKPLPAVAVAEGFKYVATASPSYPFDLYEKMKRALETNGKSYIHILCPCPAGWQFETEDTVKVGFWAVESLAFPLYEVGSGFYNLTIRTLKPRPLADYISAQGRFTDVTDKQIKTAGAKIEKEYKKLLENIQPA
jgi:pyruvate/2-oxoacid:ferredoxin oxidoreductase beta subunit